MAQWFRHLSHSVLQPTVAIRVTARLFVPVAVATSFDAFPRRHFPAGLGKSYLATTGGPAAA